MQPSTGVPDHSAHARLKRVVQRIYDIPSFPLVIARLTEVAENPNSSSQDLAKVMEHDQALSAKVLKLVNSAFYSLPRPVSSLKHAITLVGFNSVRSLAISVSVRGAFGNDEAATQFWEHSLVTACAARHLCEMNRLPIKDDLFTAGLLHDIGVLVARRYLTAEAKEAERLVLEESVDPLEAERTAIGVEHTLLGAWLAEHWSLPPLVRHVIRDHHDAAAGPPEWEESDPEMRRAVEIVSLGNELANRLGRPRIVGSAAPLGDLPVHLVPLLAGIERAQLGEDILSQADRAREFVTG